MLIEERYCLQTYNLKFNSELKNYVLPFDITELSLYEICDSPYLGRGKEIILKSPLEQGKIEEILHNEQLLTASKYNFSREILKLLKQTLEVGVVNILIYPSDRRIK